MKKSVLALAALSALAGVAHAQSSVTFYGRIDLAYSKRAGWQNQGINDTQNSRFGFKGAEDLGNGLKAIFNLESGISPDDGTTADSSKFFNRRSIVGLQDSTFGTLTLGREYTPAYVLVEKPADPWGNDTYASYEAIVRGGVSNTADKPNGTAVFGGISTTNHCGAIACTDFNNTKTSAIDQKRTDNSITYTLSNSGFNGSVQLGEKETNGTASPYKNPYSLAGSYGAGPLYIGLGYTAPGTQAPGVSHANWTTLVGTYDFGFLKAFGFYGTGRNATATTTDPSEGYKVRSWLLGASAPIGVGQLRVAYGELKNRSLSDLAAIPSGQTDKSSDGKVQEQFSVGYHYPLSKRTTLYSDVVYDSKAGYAINSPSNLSDGKSKTGYDFGIKHEF